MAVRVEAHKYVWLRGVIGPVSGLIDLGQFTRGIAVRVTPVFVDLARGGGGEGGRLQPGRWNAGDGIYLEVNHDFGAHPTHVWSAPAELEAATTGKRVVTG